MSTLPESDASEGFPTAEDRFFKDLGALGARGTGASAWSREHDWYHFVTGYKDAADTLVAHSRTVGRLVYKLGPPIVFLYRHHLELAMKQLARQCGGLLGRDTAAPVDHRLNVLWRFCLTLLEEESPGSTDSAEMRQTTRLIDEFCRVDLKSETFRYPEDQDGNPWLCGLEEIDVDRIQDVVDKISLLLDCISTGLSTRE